MEDATGGMSSEVSSSWKGLRDGYASAAVIQSANFCV
jgi:hypothetical protein